MEEEVKENNMENDTNNTNSTNSTNNITDNSYNENDDIAGLEKSTGPEVAVQDEDEEEDASLFVGDIIKVATKKHGTVKGMIYYIDENLIRVMPEGSSDRLVDIPLPDDTDNDIDIIDLAYNNGPRSSFVELLALRTGLTIQTYKADGTYLKNYTIEEVNSKTDSARIRDDTGAVETIDFNYTGIPRDVGFDVIMVKSYEPSGEEEMAIANNLNNSSVSDEAQLNFAETDEDIVIDVSEFAEMAAPEIQTFAKVSSSKIVYPEIVQKNDFLNNLISFLEPEQQTNQNYIRKLRAMVEMTSIMKNQLIKRAFDGTIVGDETISAYTLADVLSKKNVPLAYPVIDADRVLTVREQETDNTESLPGVSVEYSNVCQLPLIIEDLGKTYESIPVDRQGDYPQFYQYLNQLVEQYPPGFVYNQGHGKTIDFVQDKEFYRSIPDEQVFGLSKIGSREITYNNIKDDITYSVGRGLAASYRRGPLGEKIQAMSSTKAAHKGTILYPLQTSSIIGAIRSGKLLVDVARSHAPKQLLSQMIRQLEGIEKVEEDAKSINIQKALYFDADNARLNQMSFNDFLEITLKGVSPLGPGDLTTYQNDYGISDYEYTQEQMEIIADRVRAVISAIRARITELRAVSPPVSSIVTQVLPESTYVATLKESAAIHTPLNDAIKKFESMMPNYGESDLALTGYMLTYLQDYFYAVMSGKPTSISRETFRFHRDNLIKVRDSVFRIRKLAAEKAAPPVENSCQHVGELAAIEKVGDETKRLALMVKFRNTYAGKRDPENEHWFNCTVCKKHLLCHHTHLQLQQFLHPREKDSIHKELILTYAGRVYNGSYICSNCGVPIRQIDFDQNLEFDDLGRPLMGRTVLESAEDDAELKERLGMEDDIGHIDLDIQNPDKKAIYDIVKQINAKLGIIFNKESHKRVINNSNTYFKGIKSKTVYEDEMKKDAKDKKGALPYEVYLNRTKVLIIIAQVIIEIQSSIPNYMPQYTEPGCRAGFDGYPLIEMENPIRENVGDMIHYMACCVHPLIFKDNAPWPQTGWRLIAKPQERYENIIDSIIRVVRGIGATDYVKRKLDTKRTYLQTMYGRKTLGERPSESVPAHYLPFMSFKEDESHISAEQPITNIVVSKNSRNRNTYNANAASLQAQGWINAAHGSARKTVNKTQSLRAESASSFGSIAVPQDYIKSHADDFPELPPRLILSQGHKLHSVIHVPQIIPPAKDVDVSLDTKYSWQVFLALCYQGERVGEPHEFSVNHVCDWCGLKAPTAYLYPDVGYNGAPLIDEAEVKTFIQTQGVDMSDESFYKLVNTSHRKLIYTPYNAPQTERNSIFKSLPSLDPAPIDEKVTELEDREIVVSWQDYMNNIVSVVEKGDVKSDVGFLTQIDEFSTHMDSLKDELRNLYTVHLPRSFEGFTIGSLFDTFDKVLSGKRSFEIIRTYYLIPIQRIINDFKGVTVVRAHKKDRTTIFKGGNDPSEKAFADVLAKKQEWQTRTRVDMISKDILQTYTYKLSAYLKNASEMTAKRLPFADVLTAQLMKGFFYGPLVSLVNDAASDAERIEILRMINSLTRVYIVENRAYDVNLIREIKQKMVENEKQTMISKIDKLTPEQRKVEMQLKNKRMKSHLTGIDYSISASSAVYKYDPTADFWQNMSSIDAAYQAADGIEYVREDVYGETDAGYDVAIDHGDD